MQVQSRDLFNLKILLDAGGSEAAGARDGSSQPRHAIDTALAVACGVLAAQVLAFLEPEYQFVRNPTVTNRLEPASQHSLCQVANLQLLPCCSHFGHMIL